MKKIVCFIFLISIALGCSKSEEDNLISRDFIVKVLNTEIPIEGVKVTLLGECINNSGLWGCTSTVIGSGITNSEGRVSFTLDKRKNDEILSIECLACVEFGCNLEIICSGHACQVETVSNPSLNFSVIYLEPLAECCSQTG